MTPRRARQLLGLSTDADARAVRRAYADALRAIDPDADPHGFAELREARDAALAAVRAGAAAEEAPVDAPPEPVFGTPARAEEPHGAADAVAAAAPTDEELAEAALAEHARALAAILTPDRAAAVYLDADEQAAAHTHLDALLADPRLDGLEMRVWAEQWYADLAATAGSRADPVLPRLVTFFGWQRERGSLGQTAAVAAAVSRYDEIVFVQAVSDPKHRLHRAWSVLSGEQPGWRNLFVGKKRVRELLALVRRDHPQAESYLDTGQIHRWEHGRAGTWRTIVFGIWFFIAVVRFAATFAPDDRTRPAGGGYVPYAATPTVSTPETELPSVLAIVGGPDLTLARVDRENPVLGRWLRERWKVVSNGNRDLIGGDQRLQQELFARAAVEQQRTTYAIAADTVRLHLDEARSTVQFGWPACVDYWAGKPLPAAVAGRFGERRQVLVGRLLLAGRFTGSAPKYDGRFRVPGVAVERIAVRAGVPLDDVAAALMNRGSPRSQCAVHRALAEVALELPRKQGLPILRKL